MNQQTTRIAAKKAKEASHVLPELTSEIKNQALKTIAQSLEKNKARIFEANQLDLSLAESANLDAPLLKRLKFGEDKLQEVLAGLETLTKLDDPVGKTLKATELHPDLNLYQVSCPLGVITMIFESRPDALVQMAGLALKSGNAVLLKGGSEALHTNRILFETIGEATLDAHIPPGWIQLLESREQVSELLDLPDLIDLIIPRGSNAFVQHIMRNTLIPVMGHADGVCSIYVDDSADLDLSIPVIVDSKTQYVGVCNALENLLVHKDVAKDFLPRIKSALDAKNTLIRGCERTRKFIRVEEARESDWTTEYLDYILSIKMVDSLEEAIDFINTHGSGHTDGILTQNKSSARSFFSRVDSASVLWNCSTRFADGFRYGLGAEVGVSTGKLHARGPVGLEGLVTYKWQLIGQGQGVEEFSGPNPRLRYSHLPLDSKLNPFSS